MSDGNYPTGIARPRPEILHDLAQKTGEALVDLTHVPAVAVVMVDDNGTAVISMRGRPIDVHRIAAAVTRIAATKPRPTDCTICAEAHDRLAQANAILMQPMGTC